MELDGDADDDDDEKMLSLLGLFCGVAGLLSLTPEPARAADEPAEPPDAATSWTPRHANTLLSASVLMFGLDVFGPCFFLQFFYAFKFFLRSKVMACL